MKTRSFLSLAALTSLAGALLLTPLSRAGVGDDDRIRTLEAELEGHKPSGAVVTFVQGRDYRVLKARVWDLRASAGRIELGDHARELSIDPATGSAYLVLDTRAGQRVPRLEPRTTVVVRAGDRPVLRGTLLPVR